MTLLWVLLINRLSTNYKTEKNRRHSAPFRSRIPSVFTTSVKQKSCRRHACAPCNFFLFLKPLCVKSVSLLHNKLLTILQINPLLSGASNAHTVKVVIHIRLRSAISCAFNTSRFGELKLQTQLLRRVNLALI